MDFKHFFLKELATESERDAYARRAGTTRGYLNQVAYGKKSVGLGFAEALIAASGHQFDLDGLPLGESARKQRRVREEGSAESGRQAA